jgi:hypothetical protein
LLPCALDPEACASRGGVSSETHRCVSERLQLPTWELTLGQQWDPSRLRMGQDLRKRSCSEASNSTQLVGIGTLPLCVQPSSLQACHVLQNVANRATALKTSQTSLRTWPPAVNYPQLLFRRYTAWNETRHDADLTTYSSSRLGCACRVRWTLSRHHMDMAHALTSSFGCAQS